MCVHVHIRRNLLWRSEIGINEIMEIVNTDFTLLFALMLMLVELFQKISKVGQYDRLAQTTPELQPLCSNAANSTPYANLCSPLPPSSTSLSPLCQRLRAGSTPRGQVSS